MIVRIVIIVCC